MTDQPSKERSLTYATIYKRLTEKTKVDFEAIRSFSAAFPVGPLVDFGAGYGRLLDIGLPRKLIMVEKDLDMLRELQSRSAGRRDVEIVTNNAANTGLPDASIGACVYAYAALAEMRPIAFTLAEAHRILAPGGGIFAVLVNPECPVIDSHGLIPPADGVSDFSASLLAVPTRALGEFEYMTMVAARNGSWESTITVRQIFPSASALTKILHGLGFEDVRIVNAIDGSPFDPLKAPVFQVTAQKPAKDSLQVMQASLLKFYDSVAESYDQIVLNGSYRGMDWVKKLVKPYVHLHPRILDIGCGNGVAARTLREVSVEGRIFGIDMSEGMLKEARKTSAYAGLARWDLAQGFPIVEEVEFDLVLALGVTEFISNIQEFVQRIRRCLVVGGRALVTFELSREGIKPSGSAVTDSGIRKFHYSLEEVTNLAQSNGLAIDSLETGFAYKSPTFGDEVPYIYASFRRKTL